MTAFQQLAVQPRDRGVLIGASGCGKSTLATVLLVDWQKRCDPSRKGGHSKEDRQGRLMILDDKPRFRGQIAVTGQPIHKRYRHFVKGDTIPQAVVLDDMANWDLAWSRELNPWQTVIVQNASLPGPQVTALCVQAASKFFDTQRPSRPSLLYVDEGMGFFGPTGNARHGDALIRCFRAGREKGLATLLAAQRPKTINLQCLTEANTAYLFRVNFEDDLKRLREMSFPVVKPLTEDHVFYYARDRKVAGPLKLSL